MTTMPSPIAGFYFDQFWTHVRNKAMKLQKCDACATMIYPPAPCCPDCLSTELTWTPVSGRGRLSSAARFHRQYLPEYPAPYTVVAITLEEGPVFISCFEQDQPLAGLMNSPVVIHYVEQADGQVLPVARLDMESASPHGVITASI